MDIPVYIIEPDYFARKFIKFLLARDPRTRVVGEANSLPVDAEGMRKLPEAAVLLVSSTALPRGSEAVSQIANLRTLAPDRKIVLLALAADEFPATEMLLAGAHGFLVKQEVREGIASAIVRAMEKGPVITESVVARTREAPAEVQMLLHPLPSVKQYGGFTRREEQVIYLYGVVGMSKKEIADELRLSVDTIRKYVETGSLIIDAHDRWQAFRRLTALGDESDT